MQKIKLKDPTEYGVNGQAFAKVVGLSPHRISDMAEQGIIRKDANGLFPLCESVISYISFLKKRPKKVDADYEKARARKMEASADIEEMNAQKRRGELVEIEQVVDIVEKEYGIVRTKLFAIPNKVALDVFSCEKPEEVQEILLQQLNEALSELKYDIGRASNDDQGKDPEASAETEPG